LLWLGCSNGGSGCAPQSPESAEAERLFAEQALQAVAELKEASRACEDIRVTHDVFRGLAARVGRCMEEQVSQPFVLVGTATLDAEGLHLVAVEGGAPLVSDAVRTQCLDGTLSAFRVEAPDVSTFLAGRDAFRLQHRIELVKTGATVEVSGSTSCVSGPLPDAPELRPMTLVRDTPYIAGSDPTQDDVYKDLEACIDRLRPEVLGQPTLFAYQVTGSTDVHPSQHVCAGQDATKLDDGALCLCRAALGNDIHMGDGGLSIEMTTEDGRTVRSERPGQAVPYTRRMWVARLPTDPPTYHELTQD
jgi:hypothetical protein